MPPKTCDNSVGRLIERVTVNAETMEAVAQLVLSLEFARNERSGAYAWQCFNDRVEAIISREKNKL